MNKGFFMVFLGIIVGAMALIFLNQASKPTVPTVAGRVAADAAPAASPPPVTAERPEPAMRPRENARPVPDVVKPAPEAAKPEPATLEQRKPEQPKPEGDKPALAAAPAKPESATDLAQAPAVPGTTKPERPAAPAPAAKPESPALAAQTVSQPAASEPEPQAVQEKPRKSLTLRNIGLHSQNGGMALRIEADGPFSYKTFALPTPDRYVIDLVGKWGNMRAPKVPANMLVKSARVGSQPGGPRLVLDLQRALRKHAVAWISPTVLEIRLE